jgi:plasmid stabilization system protein ParE
MTDTASAIPNAPAQEADLDDIEAYIATFDDDERRRLAAAETAIDIAILMDRVGTTRLEPGRRRQSGRTATASGEPVRAPRREPAP